MQKNGDIFVLGGGEDTRALLRLTRLEAPGLLSRMVLIDPAPALGSEVHGQGSGPGCAPSARRPPSSSAPPPRSAPRRRRARASGGSTGGWPRSWG